ncbi:DUF1624 domain-containing protein [Candidatus Bathyarchaeota archaeon]|nr:DUF1624 domain-containing protein [Candidatus Bathyarchaeota archaeon]MBT4424391.1 DUF1624 domain-containing protein [Candidatus Bathyarchaeota archaeon]MBT5642064.1 DUF1624 domain-containing protein [Candidatus Bathyarchaeota archaeon]MBT6605558.1 DUF1624 domain-containing protein [Candidatus Bathyarchaeota archaeon]MBT7187848.1 DUF1624 domain-containing protein [Candidatus Bathyarchaeota archaeon]
MASKPAGRLQFIDFTRGLVMAIMAWDHVSGFWNQFHQGSEGVMGAMRPFMNTTWFLVRFVSHYCAPTFIFLAGTVLAISTIKREARGESQFDISGRIVIRGIVLLVAESLIVAPAFGTPWAYFGVIACIGLNFIIFSFARKLPNWLILALSLFIVFNHNFINLDFIPNDVAWGHYLRVILHEPNFEMRPWVGLYPILPWLGVMGMGWVFGSIISGYTPEQIRGLEGPLRKIGLASIGLFILVRGINGYGNLLPRQGWSLVDWLYVSKYPPSQAFLLWTLGGMCLFMSYALKHQDKSTFNTGVTGVLNQYGRVPLFFYLTHLWLYRLRLPGAPGMFYMPMVPTLALWVLGLYVLYELCKRYEILKRNHRGSVLQYI